MIKINLLPAEKRKAERTPLPRFFLIITTVAAAVILALYNFWVYLQIMGVRDDIKARQTELASLQPFVQEHDKLVAEHTTLKNKVSEIEGLITRDVEFWRTVNALWDVIHNHPRVWIDDLRILDTRSAPGELKRVDPDSKDAVPYGVSFRAHVASDEISEMTKFRKSLKEHPILQETLTLINFNVDWSISEEKGFEEKNSIGFSISMFGLATPPKRKAPAPATPVKAAAVAVPTAPAAPKGDIK